MRVDEAPIEGALAVLTTPATEVADDLVALADGMAEASARFVQAAEAIAAGIGEEHAIAILLLEVSDVLAVGARLGAIGDVVPEGRFEPDAGAEPDVDRLRDALAERLAPVDSYVEVFDPYANPELVAGRLSDDLTAIVSDLLHGLAHHTCRSNPGGTVVVADDLPEHLGGLRGDGSARAALPGVACPSRRTARGGPRHGPLTRRRAARARPGSPTGRQPAPRGRRRRDSRRCLGVPTP